MRIFFNNVEMINKIQKTVFILILFCLSFTLLVLAEEADSPFYPDLQFSGNVVVAGNEVPDNETVVLRSVSAIKKEEGKCAVTFDYEIYNKGAIAVSQRFFSGIEINGTIDSSRLVKGIGANEKKTINAVIWLNPGETTEVRILLDNFNNVKEVSEDNNTRTIKILLNGSCESGGETNTIEEGNEKGLFKKYQFKK